MADYDPDYQPPAFDDGSPLAAAEITMMQSLSNEQAELVAQWMSHYGYAWEREDATCGEHIRTCFHYSAERLRVLAKNALPNNLQQETSS